MLPLRGRAKHCWWVLFIDEASGCVTVQSDYGNWSHCWFWPNTGFSTTAEFLVSASEGYLTNKFSYGHACTWDETGTRESLARDLIERRRAGDVDAETARAAYDDLSDVGDAVSFDRYVTNHGHEAHDADHRDMWEHARQFRAPPALTQFMKRVWPHVVVDLVKRITEERTHLEPSHCRTWGSDCNCASENVHRLFLRWGE